MKKLFPFLLFLTVFPALPIAAQIPTLPKSVSPVGAWQMGNNVYAFKPGGSGFMRLPKNTTPLRWKQEKNALSIELRFKDGGRTDQFGTIAQDGKTLTITRQRIRNGLIPAFDKGDETPIRLTFRRR